MQTSQTLRHEQFIALEELSKTLRKVAVLGEWIEQVIAGKEG